MKVTQVTMQNESSCPVGVGMEEWGPYLRGTMFGEKQAIIRFNRSRQMIEDSPECAHAKLIKGQLELQEARGIDLAQSLASLNKGLRTRNENRIVWRIVGKTIVCDELIEYLRGLTC